MKQYNKVIVSEQQLEDLVRVYSRAIEDGLTFLEHQRVTARGRLDVLMVDGEKSLVVAELKVVEDDGMLMQGLDYYDWVSTHVESFARLHKTTEIDPSQKVRLILIAPSFSQTLINRCKWLKVQVSLFTFVCLQFEKDPEIVPVFTEQQIPETEPLPELVTRDQILNWIKDQDARPRATAFLQEITSWQPTNIVIDPLGATFACSIKINGHVFAYLYPKRQYFVVGTYDAADDWRDFPVRTDEDLNNLRPVVKAAMERHGSR